MAEILTHATLTPQVRFVDLRFTDRMCPLAPVVVDKSTGEGVIRSHQEKLDVGCRRTTTFTIQAYDCGKGPDGASVKDLTVSERDRERERVCVRPWLPAL